MPPRHVRAVRALQSADPKLAPWIERVGRCTWRAEAGGTHFAAIARSIVYQQLSGAAAGTIHGRFCALFPEGSPEPRRLLTLSVATLRGVGLSGRKTEYLQALAERSLSGGSPIERLHELDDADVIDTLAQVRGIGTWTAQMFLMFRLGRPDVLPILDLGVRKGVQRVHRMRALPTPAQVEKIGARWAPYRTIASWYLWRSLEVEL